ncbi:spirocyclase AveC family protein [Frankia sp. AgB1.9]|uniref:spirocyclase AveC family protein n=1 Tax=unclassified Frankia TaxID=2632575 RepID=UPI0019319C6D|nr:MULTISPECIES: spirocyclase AveC family protein [unclassified Frankia]MBL7490701.1 spirocyclase AveC family protein [Frankia sp. AgW1.1]MBL7547711.1 spirocyclase AveC family protein [Frankia sp. AgB1.9]MBL7622647.1 spirocyclase AveC family protein [Frankia sp. AgB1.8]
MSDGLTPALLFGQVFAYVGGLSFLAAGIVLTVRRRRLHPLLLLCISAISFSWIEAPYDWAMYAQFAPGLPRMPSWWPLNLTWGGLPVSVPLGYIEYFVLPALLGVALERRLRARFGWRRPIGLLTVGLVVGYSWALLFNGVFGVRAGVFYYGRVISGLAMFEGTRHQYPLYDALAMGVQMMVFTYLLGRTDPEGRTVIDAWAERRTKTPARAVALSVASVIVLGNLLYGAVFAPHLATKLNGDVTVGPTTELFPGVPNQPPQGGAGGGQ